jgi:hypothetical protein
MVFSSFGRIDGGFQKADKELMSTLVTHSVSCSLRVGGRAYQSTLSSFKVIEAIPIAQFYASYDGRTSSVDIIFLSA